MKTDYTAYPPQLAADVEITEQRDGQRTVFIVGSAGVGRYLLLRAVERQIVALLDGTRTAGAVCYALRQLTGVSLSLAALVKFLAKLDSYGILAGESAQGAAAPEAPLSQRHYVRIPLFNPDPLFSRLVPKLRWIWTTGFFVVMTSLMVLALLLALTSASEVVSYSTYMVREHFLVIFFAGGLVGITHEFAHGLTCKAFGGRATEIGVLLFYGIVPGEYCNVTAIHLIPQRNRRLWVIAAGFYWQLMVCACNLLAWFLLAPHTLLSDTAFVFALGSGLDVFFNANPLIKFDGYYFLSQWLRLPNLMDRSRAYWRGVLKRMLFGERNREAARYDRRERTIYLVFGLLSFVYNVAFASVILVYVGDWLIEQFYLPGLALAFGLALLFLRRPLKQLLNPGYASLLACWTSLNVRVRKAWHAGSDAYPGFSKERKMADNNETTTQVANKDARPPFWRRRLAPLALALLAVVLLLMPWSASVGAYGSLVAIPEREAIIRAPESATLIELAVKPGDAMANGAVVGRMGNLELEERLVEAQAELARANSDYDRLLGELRAHGEAVARTELLLRQRRNDYDEINAEQRQIEERRRVEPSAAKYLMASAMQGGAPPPAAQYPAAFAVLQSDVDLRRARLEESRLQLDRARKLHVQGIVARSELDAAETQASALGIELAAARDRLEAALIEHRRKHTNVATEMQVARSDAGAASLQVEKLSGELRSLRGVIGTLEDRRDLLLRKRAQFELVTPRAGAVFGEDLPRSVGRHFQKGDEICRVADTRQLLVRIQVSEREIGDVSVGRPVRLKVRAYPDQTFHGKVVKIGGESELDQNQQAVYRVELMIENAEELLRPGMTAYARIEFGRQMVGRILLHKIKQALRPELWML
jgi:multidrug resistance efflux pump